jgi:hypothetical protein
MEELNRLKALDSFGHCHIRWVKDVMCRAVGDNILITGRVSILHTFTNYDISTIYEHLV